MPRFLFLTISSACLLFASFPPVSFWPLAWIAFIPLFLLFDHVQTKRAAFGWAYVTGLIFFLAVLQWIHFVTTLGLILLASYLALYFGAFGIFYLWAGRFPAGFRLFLLPAGWTVLEYIRGTFLTGFNWGSLGHSQASFTALLGIASMTGVSGVSFVVMAGNLVAKEMLMAFRDASRRRDAFLGFVLLTGVVLCVLVFFQGRSMASSKAASVTVAVVQPNISLVEAWSPGLRADLVRGQIEMSRRTLKERPGLIIWPENSFPQPIWELPELFDEVRAFARENQVSLLIGAVTKEGEKYYNSALLIWPSGNVVKVHSKRHLVLFGEYIPFRKEFPFLSDIVPIDDFTPGGEDTIFELPTGVKFSVLICFEDTIPELARRYVHKGADFLVNMTNDAWFRDSGQPRMHLNNALFRSVENKRVLVRSTNTGESCGVDKDGRVGRCVEDPDGRRVLVEGTSVVTVPLYHGQTMYTKYGEIFTFLCFLGILGALAGLGWDMRKGKIHGHVKKDPYY